MSSKLVLPDSTRSLVRFIDGPACGGTSMTVIGMCTLSTVPLASRLRAKTSYEPAATFVASTS